MPNVFDKIARYFYIYTLDMQCELVCIIDMPQAWVNTNYRGWTSIWTVTLKTNVCDKLFTVVIDFLLSCRGMRSQQFSPDLQVPRRASSRIRHSRTTDPLLSRSITQLNYNHRCYFKQWTLIDNFFYILWQMAKLSCWWVVYVPRKELGSPRQPS